MENTRATTSGFDRLAAGCVLRAASASRRISANLFTATSPHRRRTKIGGSAQASRPATPSIGPCSLCAGGRAGGCGGGGPWGRLDSDRQSTLVWSRGTGRYRRAAASRPVLTYIREINANRRTCGSRQHARGRRRRRRHCTAVSTPRYLPLFRRSSAKRRYLCIVYDTDGDIAAVAWNQ